jgi:hypothetical protein
MKCPKCGEKASLRSPDYGRGVEYSCYNYMCAGRSWDYRFMSDSPEAKRESDASRTSSRANAECYRAELKGSNVPTPTNPTPTPAESSSRTDQDSPGTVGHGTSASDIAVSASKRNRA